MVRYDMGHEVGVGIGDGGLFTGVRRGRTLTVPSWATSAIIEIVDDRGTPVAGRVDVHGSDSPSWAGRRVKTSHTICNGATRPILVPPGGSLDLRVIAGVLSEPNDVQRVGDDGRRSDPCQVRPSSPTTGVITVTFRA